MINKLGHVECITIDDDIVNMFLKIRMFQRGIVLHKLTNCTIAIHTCIVSNWAVVP